MGLAFAAGLFSSRAVAAGPAEPPASPPTPTQPASTPTVATPPAAQPATPVPSGQAIDDAIARGDLGRALDLAVAARNADPSPANLRREAEVLERMGTLQYAEAAWRRYLEALPAQDAAGRGEAQAHIDALRARARATVSDEQPSTHRSELDRKWAPAPSAAPPVPAAEPAAAPPKDRIVTKWYFWVTLAAIVASAAAVTGIAIKAAAQERHDALDAGIPSGSGPGLRF